MHYLLVATSHVQAMGGCHILSEYIPCKSHNRESLIHNGTLLSIFPNDKFFEIHLFGFPYIEFVIFFYEVELPGNIGIQKFLI